MPLALFVLLFVLERFFPLRRARCPLGRRLLVNLAVSALAFGVSLLLVQPAAAWALDLRAADRIGLVHWLGLPTAAAAVAGFLLMDLTFYWWHRPNHAVPFLWRFHNVHHIDPDLDVSTSFRFHFGETGLSTIFRVAQVTAIGVSPAVFAVYTLVFQANTLFHHSNLRLPLRLEHWVNRVLVTPRMHGVHHSQVAEENYSNFSVVFSWWDRLHRSLRVNVPQSRIEIGISGYARPEQQGIVAALLAPFRPQRAYWRGDDGERPRRDPAELGAFAADPAHMVS